MTTDQRANVTHFLRGRDLAVEMLREACVIAPSGQAVIDAAERGEGEAQRNFVRRYVDDLRRRPELAEGFAAVLSDRLAGSGFDAEQYARLSLRDMVGS